MDASVGAFDGVRSPGRKRVTATREQLALCLSNAAECLLRLGLAEAAGRLASAAIATEPMHAKSASRLTRSLQAAASRVQAPSDHVAVASGAGHVTDAASEGSATAVASGDGSA